MMQKNIWLGLIILLKGVKNDELGVDYCGVCTAGGER